MTLDYFYGQAGELFSFYRIPKALFQEQRFQILSTDAKTLYGILLDRMSLSVKNEWLDNQGRVFIIFTIEDVKRVLCCADNKAMKGAYDIAYVLDSDVSPAERKAAALEVQQLLSECVKGVEGGVHPNANRGKDEVPIFGRSCIGLDAGVR